MSPEQTDKLLVILDRAATAYEHDVELRAKEGAAREERAKKSDDMIAALIPIATRLISESMGGPRAVDGPDATVTPLHDDTKGPTQ